MEDVFLNKILMITVSVWVITQTMKVMTGVVRERRFNFKWLVKTGGMPSSHAAGATALATACGLETGFHSVPFAISAVFALVTMFDAQGVRRATGLQATILNQIMDDIYWRGKFDSHRLFELIGHTPTQVIIGAFLGATLASFFYNHF